MSFDKLAGIFVYCNDYHSGQGTRLYRLMSKINMYLTDRAWDAIRDGNNEEWLEAHEVYQKLKDWREKTRRP